MQKPQVILGNLSAFLTFDNAFIIGGFGCGEVEGINVAYMT